MELVAFGVISLCLILAAFALSIPPRIKSCAIFCPGCKNDLVEDGEASHKGPSASGMEVYCCSKCGVWTVWDFDTPAPFLRSVHKWEKPR